MSSSFEPVTIQGRYLWKGESRFLVKGIVYQVHRREERRRDPLADDRIEALRKDIDLFKELGLNTIFTFHHDPAKSHDASMSLLAEAGIHVLTCLHDPWNVINRSAPLESYTPALMDRFFASIDSLSAYPNVLGVLAGHEVINSPESSGAAGAIRAVVRDLKRYMRMAASEASGEKQRVLPVGYSHSAEMMTRMPTFKFLSAGPEEEAVDFFCFNDYSWIGKASMQISGWKRMVKLFSNTHIPLFLSEYGGKIIQGGPEDEEEDPPRIFQETTALYSPAMTPVFSGGIAYELHYGANRYGIVRPVPAGGGGEDVERTEEFRNLKRSLRLGSAYEPITLAEWTGGGGGGGGGDALRAPEMPARSASWQADAGSVPASPVDWDAVRARLEDREWIDVVEDMKEKMVDDLVGSAGARISTEEGAGTVAEDAGAEEGRQGKNEKAVEGSETTMPIREKEQASGEAEEGEKSSFLKHMADDPW